MAVKRVTEGVHVVPMGMANAFLIEGDDGLTLIDAGYPGKEAAVFSVYKQFVLNNLRHSFRRREGMLSLIFGGAYQGGS